MAHDISSKNEFIKGLSLTMLISGGFFAVSALNHQVEIWGKIAGVSLGYGLSIYGSIFAAYLLIGFFKDSLTFIEELITSLAGLLCGALIGENIRALVLSRSADYSNTPNIILIGVFITLMFLYIDRSKRAESEAQELTAINQKLEQKKNAAYLTSLSTKVGNTTKVIPVNDITCFVSEDHCTVAYTADGEYIVEPSIKKLSESLDPLMFIQIHRNSIVRLDEIASVKNGNNWIIETKSGRELNVSRNSRKRLKESLL